MLTAQQPRLCLVVGVLADRLVSGYQVDRVLAALFRRQRITGAAKKHAGTGGADLHGPTTLAAGDIRHRGFVGLHAVWLWLLCLLEEPAEFRIEAVEEITPGQLPGGDIVEILFHAGREPVIEQLAEAALQPLSNNVAHFFSVETLVLKTDVAAVLDGGDNRCVSRRPSDAALFQLTHQAGLGVARRWLCEVLGGFQLDQLQNIALGDIG